MALFLQSNNIKYLAIGLFLGIGVSTQIMAESEKPLPENIEGTHRISASELIELVASKDGLILIDSRIPGDRIQGYIKTSISLPDTDTDCQSLSKVIASKNQPVAFYCNGVRCGRSAVAIKIALSCGYQELYWYKNGFEDWLERSYPYVKD